MNNLARAVGEACHRALDPMVASQSDAGEGDRVVSQQCYSAHAPRHPHPVLRAALIRFAASVHFTARAHAKRGRGLL